MYHSLRTRPSGDRWKANAHRLYPLAGACAALLLAFSSFLSLTQTAASYLSLPTIAASSSSGLLIVLSCTSLALLSRRSTSRVAFLTLAASFLPTFLYNLFWSMTRLGIVSSLLLSVVQIATVLVVCALRVLSLLLLARRRDRLAYPLQSKLAAVTIVLYTIGFLCPVPVALLVKKDTAILLEPYLMRIVRYGYLAQCLHMLQLGVLALTEAHHRLVSRHHSITKGDRA